MAKVDIKSVYRVTSKGHTYFYAWRGKGAPRLFAPVGSPEFVAELNAALTERSSATKNTVSWACQRYRSSDEYRSLAQSTRRQWSRWLDQIDEHFGPLSLLQFDRPKVRVIIRKWRDKWKATPRTADYGLQVLSRVLSYAVGEGWIRDNPCVGIPRLYSANRSERIWTPDDLGKLQNVASREIWWAVQAAMLTGMRQGDLLKLSWTHINEHSIELTTGKSRNKRTIIVPIYAPLRALLESIPKRATTVLTNSEGVPWKSGFGSSWNKAIIAAKLQDSDLHFHDLRGNAVTSFYGTLSNAEIAVIVGWAETKVERLIDRYVKKGELIREQVRRLENAARTKSAKPCEKLTA